MWIDKDQDPVYISDSQGNHQRLKTNQKEHFYEPMQLNHLFSDEWF